MSITVQAFTPISRQECVTEVHVRWALTVKRLESNRPVSLLMYNNSHEPFLKIDFAYICDKNFKIKEHLKVYKIW